MDRHYSIKSRNYKIDGYFVDLFAGCGGLSLGLLAAGWNGKFAIEKNADAYNTLSKNLVKDGRKQFNWPKWLPQKPISTSYLLSRYGKNLETLKGTVDLIAGGPPCQGFSFAGRRTHSDPRNILSKEYIRLVRKLQPRMLLFENVQGFNVPFRKNGRGTEKTIPYSHIITKRLERMEYTVFSELINFKAFGVPQNRKRFILVAIKNDDPALKKLNGKTPFDLLRDYRRAFLVSKGLNINKPVSTKQAIADLEITGKSLIRNTETKFKRFKQIDYAQTKASSPFITLMRKGVINSPDGLRLPQHETQTVEHFQTIMKTCKQGKSLGEANMKRLQMKKHTLTPLHPNLPSATITSLPDDMIHYSEPRILTVRENARLQTFPDWYSFTGKYTTGGIRRRKDCPRYTQVANAVPPLFAEALGIVLKRLSDSKQ